MMPKHYPRVGPSVGEFFPLEVEEVRERMRQNNYMPDQSAESTTLFKILPYREIRGNELNLACVLFNICFNMPAYTCILNLLFTYSQNA